METRSRSGEVSHWRGLCEPTFEDPQLSGGGVRPPDRLGDYHGFELASVASGVGHALLVQAQLYLRIGGTHDHNRSDRGIPC